MKVQHVNSKGRNEPQWNCSNYLPDLAKMTLSSFGSPEPYANLRKKSRSWPEIPQCSNLTWFPENLAPKSRGALVFIRDVFAVYFVW